LLRSAAFDTSFAAFDTAAYDTAAFDTVAFWSIQGLFSFFFSPLLVDLLNLLNIDDNIFFNSLKDYKSINWVKVKYQNSWNNRGLISCLRYKPDTSLLKTFSEHYVPLYSLGDWKLLQLCQSAIYWLFCQWLEATSTLSICYILVNIFFKAFQCNLVSLFEIS